MEKLEKLWIDLRSSLWFVPATLVAAAILVALGVVELDTLLDPSLAQRWPRLFGVSAEGARGILLAISSSTITVAGVIFSITIVALTVASTQYTPRILRNFMRDVGTQMVLGVFVAVFTYSLIVMRTVRSGEQPFVPALAVALAILMALISVGFLVYFIHHIAAAMQAPTVIASIASETVVTIKQMFPESTNTNGPTDRTFSSGISIELHARETGYLQNISGALVRLAHKHDLLIRVEKKMGEFVVAETPLLSVSGATGIDAELEKKLLDCVAIDDFRTVEQDPSYGIRQLVDIAIKALSPGVNDTSTAINCVDYLGAILHTLVQRCPVQDGARYRGKLRLIYRRPLDFERLINEALLQIRQSASGNPAVLLRLLKLIGTTVDVAKNHELSSVFQRHIELIDEIARQSLHSKKDLEAVLARITWAKERAEILGKGVIS